MKKKTMKRIVAGCLLVGLLSAIGIGAYLTDTDVKQDVYTVGNVQAEIVSNGDMELDNVGALLPGTVHQYERAAMNTGINDAYVFMSITIPYEMIGVADSDGTQLGEKTMQIFIPGSADGYVSSEWKLVDSGFIGQYEIEENEQLNGEHEQYSTVVGNTITYVYGYIGDNADGSLNALASGETTANLVETMELTNLYRADNINGEVSTKLYAIQSNHVNGGLTDVNGVWAVINHALVGTENEVQSANALMVGELFNAYIPNDVSSVEFVAMPQTYGLRSATAPEGAFDVSAAQDGSVMAWAEDGVFYVAAMNGEKIIANKNSDKMFYEKTNLTYINTENLDMSQVESAACMFKKCANLTNSANDFNLANVKNIEATFYGCNWLTEYTVPDSVEVIGEAAFANCSNLSNIEIPESVKSIEAWAFQFTTSLTSIKLPNSLETLGGYGVFMSWPGRVCGLTEIIIPASVTSIGEQAFAGCENLTSVTFEDGSQLKEIGDAAFMGSGLTEIDIPASVTSIGLTSINKCLNLTTINVDPANENYVSVNGVLYSKDMKTLVAYPAGKTDAEYTIPASVVVIDNYAFADSINLTSIVFEDGSQLKEIGNLAFSDCSSLASINIPSSVTHIGTQAFVDFNDTDGDGYIPWFPNEFYNCYNNKELFIIGSVLIDASVASGEFVIPEGITQIYEYAFSYCSNITSVVIPTSVNTINYGAFYNATFSVINYRGTEAQWNELVEASPDWDYGIMTEYTINFNYIPEN